MLLVWLEWIKQASSVNDRKFKRLNINKIIIKILHFKRYCVNYHEVVRYLKTNIFILQDIDYVYQIYWKEMGVISRKNILKKYVCFENQNTVVSQLIIINYGCLWSIKKKMNKLYLNLYLHQKTSQCVWALTRLFTVYNWLSITVLRHSHTFLIVIKNNWLSKTR